MQIHIILNKNSQWNLRGKKVNSIPLISTFIFTPFFPFLHMWTKCKMPGKYHNFDLGKVSVKNVWLLFIHNFIKVFKETEFLKQFWKNWWFLYINGYILYNCLSASLGLLNYFPLPGHTGSLSAVIRKPKYTVIYGHTTKFAH